MEHYLKAEPFPHCIIDNFWDEEELSKAVNELENLPEHVWYGNLNTSSNECEVQRKKMCLSLPEYLEGYAPTLQKIMIEMNSPKIVQMLENLTGIKGLITDPQNYGGGLHRVRNEGKLSIHADFNVHPITKNYRRINALLYLNKNWYFNGDLELWKSDMSDCVKKISPIFNRLVVFTITDNALHGHPEKLICPPERSRFSLATYYYTSSADNETAPHVTIWYQRRGLGY